MTRVNFFIDNFDSFYVIRECYYGFIRLSYHIIPRYFKLLLFKRSNKSITSLNVTSDPVISSYNDYS